MAVPDDDAVLAGATGAQAAILPYAGASLVLYGLGVPVLLAFVLVKNRAAIQRDQRLWLRGRGDSAADNLDYRVRRRYARMYQEFAVEFWGWRLLLMARKVCFLSVATFASNPMFQTSLALAILAASYGLQRQYMPFVSALEQHTVALREYGLADAGGGAAAAAITAE